MGRDVTCYLGLQVPTNKLFALVRQGLVSNCKCNKNTTIYCPDCGKKSSQVETYQNRITGHVTSDPDDVMAWAHHFAKHELENYQLINTEEYGTIFIFEMIDCNYITKVNIDMTKMNEFKTIMQTYNLWSEDDFGLFNVIS